jgi:hypothetical protein
MDNLKNRGTYHSNTNLGNHSNLDTNVEKVSPTSYQEGYIQGRASERSIENERQEIRDEKTATRGLVIGAALTTLVGLTAGTLFFLNQNQANESSTPVVVPPRTASQQPAKETTIIERNTEIQQVPTVDQNPSVDTQDSQPDIQITVPSSGQQQAPTQQKTTPQTVPAQPQSQSSPTNPSATQPNTTSQTAPIAFPDTQPYLTNPGSSTQPQNQTSTGTSDTTGTSGATSTSNPSGTSNNSGTSTTAQPTTTNQASPTQTQSQNQSQSPNSDSGQ